MSEQFILEYIPKRIAQLGFCNYHIRYRDRVINPFAPVEIPAYNELFFIVDEPVGLMVESDYGFYNPQFDPPLELNQHEHRGRIVITNTGTTPVRIKFIQVIIVN